MLFPGQYNPVKYNLCLIQNFNFFAGLLKHWQEMFYHVEKQLNITEKLSKLILDIQVS